MASGEKEMDFNEAKLATGVLSHSAEEIENNPDVELMWVIKATEHMEVYFNLLTSVDPRLLRLTPHEDKIYEEFRKEFPQFDVNILDEKELKSAEAKEKWRPFCNKFEQVVEDFNFGTIIRLDSSGEYTNENSIFVPRIQFYAIEIARNREGYNDSIRKIFGCTRKQAMNKSCNDAENQCMTSRFEIAMQEFMDRFCLQHKLSPIKLCKLLRKDDGNLKRGDYLLLCGNPDACYLSNYLHEIGEVLPCFSNSWCLPVACCKVLPAHHLQLFLDRNVVFRNVLAAVNKRKKNYGMNQTGKSKQLIIHSTFHHISKQKSRNTLTYLRTKLISQHIGSILCRNGYIVYSSQHDDTREEELSKDKDFHLKESKLKEVEESLKESAHHYIHEIDKEVKEKNEKKTTDNEIAFDALKFLLDRNLPIGPKGYNQNIGYIYINSVSWKDICKQIAQLEHIVQENTLQDPDVIHISPHNKAYLQHQVGICLQALHNKNPKHQMFFTHAPVVWKDPEHNAVTVEEYITQIQKELEKSLVLKYGKQIIGLPWQKEYLKVLSDTVVKFDLLLPSPSIPIKLSHPTIDIPVNQNGTFVQYNCARLAMLFEKHDNLVSTGCYPHLPDIENIDFSLLILEEEWNLLYNYLLVFPQLISSIIEEIKKDNIRLQVPTHKICRFLVNLSHDLSAYYSRVHILIEPRSHLLPTISARLWLLKAVQQIMHNALDLLAISPLQKM